MRIMFDEVRNNKIKSIILVSFFIIIIGAIGAVIGLVYDNLYFGLITAMIVALVYSIFGFLSGSRMILSMSGAKPVTKREYPHLYHTVEALAISAGIPAPKVYIIDDSALNAFATGTNPQNASISITTGLLKTMNRQELEGVISHEMSHIKNYDVRFMMLTVVLVGIITMLSDFMLRTFLWGGKNKKEIKGGGGSVFILIAIGLILAILSQIIGEMIKQKKRVYGLCKWSYTYTLPAWTCKCPEKNCKRP